MAVEHGSCESSKIPHATDERLQKRYVRRTCYVNLEFSLNLAVPCFTEFQIDELELVL
ncbi:hypothetical protein Htur_4867 (plasmid) [Haloterrigena turkmenica DSM 5511]|uniref:Uncharacterized protein n=1 Tax=Haloterrigena turkmenica (strain ATCC 51198 / DSM 5511 / JCM 9101 / NCIMB 13204 / VKM B-1734 / 4k) TaxID=543526 RepID=D2S2M6_HALTV|nr:hypothetical protein Htur_4867 [Haloterrigena turkmenica DSM 5511]